MAHIKFIEFCTYGNNIESLTNKRERRYYYFHAEEKFTYETVLSIHMFDYKNNMINLAINAYYSENEDEECIYKIKQTYRSKDMINQYSLPIQSFDDIGKAVKNSIIYKTPADYESENDLIDTCIVYLSIQLEKAYSEGPLIRPNIKEMVDLILKENQIARLEINRSP